MDIVMVYGHLFIGALFACLLGMSAYLTLSADRPFHFDPYDPKQMPKMRH